MKTSYDYLSQIPSCETAGLKQTRAFVILRGISKVPSVEVAHLYPANCSAGNSGCLWIKAYSFILKSDPRSQIFCQVIVTTPFLFLENILWKMVS